MKVLPTRLTGLVHLEPEAHGDGRGFFLETYRRTALEALGIRVDFVQDNHSRSARGTLRGLHFQSDPGQAKLVRVARGRAWDVVVDLRRSSPTYGEHEAFELDDERHRQLFIPVGFAHGFCALSETVDFTYKVSSYYDPATERGVAWNDPGLSVPWPIADPVVSDRDRALPTLGEIEADLPEW